VRVAIISPSTLLEYVSVCACCDLSLFSIFFVFSSFSQKRKKEELFMASTIFECDELAEEELTIVTVFWPSSI
jgi:hypothetical protein